MKNLLDKIFPTLSDELIIVISLIIGLLVTASLILFLVKKISPKTNISELAARTRSWWIMAGMFIGAVFISYNISYFFLAFLSFIAFRELYSVLGFREADRGALFWGILAIHIQYYLAYLAWYGAFIIFIPVVKFLVLPLRLVLKGDTHGITKSMALLQWILMLSVFGISHLAYLLSLPELPGFSSGGRGLLLFLVFLNSYLVAPGGPNIGYPNSNKLHRSNCRDDLLSAVPYRHCDYCPVSSNSSQGGVSSTYYF